MTARPDPHGKRALFEAPPLEPEESIDDDPLVGGEPEEGLEALLSRGVPFLVSYDGRSGETAYGEPLPDGLGLVRIEDRVVRRMRLHAADRLAEYQDAAREYNALTGSFVVPASTLEPLSETRELDENHPVLQRALDQYSESSAATEVASQENTARPSVNVFWRNFRGDRNAPGVDALGLGFSLPLGKSPARGPEIARAHEELARAEAQLLQIRRDLDLECGPEDRDQDGGGRHLPAPGQHGRA